MVAEYQIHFECAPGDIVASTALIRDLKRRYQGDIRLAYETNQPEILVCNPYLERVSKNATQITLDYSEGLRRSRAGEHVHFIRWFHEFWEQRTGMPVALQRPYPDLHLPAKLKKEPPISGSYWLVFAGGKTDFTLKHWDFKWYERVVDSLRRYCGIWCVQSGALGDDHVHPHLNSAVLNLVGWGGLIEMMWQIYHCQGVICPITCAMHMAAAFHKPCVVIAGGREEPWWAAYNHDYNQFLHDNRNRAAEINFVEHKFLHTLGMLPCCEESGCGRSFVRHADPSRACVALADRPAGQQSLPQCMQLIEPVHVVSAVDKYVSELGLSRSVEPPRLIANDVPFLRKS